MANEMKADEGFVFAKADKSAVYGTLMYLGIHDSPDNYIQIPLEEAEALKEEIRAKHEAEMEARRKEATAATE